MTDVRTPDTAIPDVGTTRRYAFVAAMVVDALGSGMWMPFAIVFFTRAQGQSLSMTGAAMTAGGVLGLIAGIRAGHLVDRRGAGVVAIASNLLRVGSFAAYPFVRSPWQLVLAVSVTACADRMFWTANAPMFATLFRGRQLDDMMGTTGVVRIVGLGVGAGLAGLVAGSPSGLHTVAWVNAGSFGLAAGLLALGLGRHARAATRPTGDERPGGGRVSLRADRPYLLLCLVQVILAFAGAAFVLILPIVVLGEWRGPAWLPGAAIVVGNVSIALAQKPVLRIARRLPRVRMLLVAVTLMALAALLLAPAGHLPPATVVPLVVTVMALVGVSQAISAPLLISAANEAAPDGHKGRYSAVFQTGWGAAEVAAPLALTTLLAVGDEVLWLGVTAVALPALPLLLHLRSRLPAGILDDARAGGGVPGRVAVTSADVPR